MGRETGEPAGQGRAKGLRTGVRWEDELCAPFRRDALLPEQRLKARDFRSQGLRPLVFMFRPVVFALRFDQHECAFRSVEPEPNRLLLQINAFPSPEPQSELCAPQPAALVGDKGLIMKLPVEAPPFQLSRFRIVTKVLWGTKGLFVKIFLRR